MIVLQQQRLDEVELQIQRHEELVSYLQERQHTTTHALSINELADLTYEWIRQTLINTGKKLALDLLTEEILRDYDSSSSEDTKLFRSILVGKLQEDDELHIRQVCDQVYSVECQKKIDTISNLPKLLRLMYEARFANPEMVSLAMKKLNEDEIALMEKVLLFE